MNTNQSSRKERRRQQQLKKKKQLERLLLIAIPAVVLLVLLFTFIPRLLSTKPVDQTTTAPSLSQPETSPVDETKGGDIASDEALEPEALIDGESWEEEDREVDAAPSTSPTASVSASGVPTGWGHRELGEIVSGANIQEKRLGFQGRVYKSGKIDTAYQRAEPIYMGPPEEYAQMEGVTTFRGNNYRDNSGYGTVPDDAKSLKVIWSESVSGIDEWNGVGWTGQAAIVKWPDDVKQQMNIKESKKKKEDLKEVVIAALDGHIRFLDLDDGKETRKAISIGAPIKGSVTVDPRGYPLLYCGQGIFEVHGKTVKCATRIFNLIDQKVVLALNGDDKFKTRNWYCFDAAPLIDGKTDTMIQLGENGLVYLVKLNTMYDREAGTIAINPEVDRFGYKSKVTKRPGMENSVAVYSHYAFFVDNSGLLICLDLNTLEAKWATPTGDDTDATCAIEEDDEGVWLYTANEMDLRGDSGNIQMRCYNAMTGEVRWKGEANVSNKTLAGSFASPAIGKKGLKELVYFNISKTSKGGTLFAVDKVTGKVVWSKGLGAYSWSTPSLMYDSNGRGYLLLGNSNGTLRLIDGSNGEFITSIELKNNIEGSPAVYNDIAVVSTRGGKIYGVKIS